MTETLSSLIALLTLVAGFGWLVQAVRHDVFGGPGTGYRPGEGLVGRRPRT